MGPTTCNPSVTNVANQTEKQKELLYLSTCACARALGGGSVATSRAALDLPGVPQQSGWLLPGGGGGGRTRVLELLGHVQVQASSSHAHPGKGGAAQGCGGHPLGEVGAHHHRAWLGFLTEGRMRGWTRGLKAPGGAHAAVSAG